MAKATSKGARSALGIEMTRDVKVQVDWAAMSTNVLEFFSKTILSSVTTGNVASGTGNLIGAVKSVNAEMSLGEKAWHISMLSFGWALSEIAAVVDVSAERQLTAAVKELLEKAGERVDGGAEVAPYEFLARPTSLPLYQFLRSEALKYKTIIRNSISESDNVFFSKLDAAYDRGMYEVYLRRPDLFESFLAVNRLDVFESAQKQLDWSAYRQKLIYDFNVKPVFGQEVTRLSLQQMYVPLRGYWRRHDDLPVEIELDHHSDHFEYGWIEELLIEWLTAGRSDDNIRLLGGGPGSGKSTTLRSLSSKLALRSEVRPLFVPLQHISLDGDLRDSINRYFAERTSGDFHHPPLGRSNVEDGPPLVLIFDGLDEIARPGEAATEVVGLFSAKLANLIAALRGDGQQALKVIVSGRMPAFQAAKRYLTPPREGCIEVYGYTPVPGKGADHIGELDQRGEWWRQYAKLSGLSADVPPAFSNEKLASLTHEPLLCYLLVLSGFAIANWERAAENPNIIYRQLVDSIWDRGWGEGAIKRQGPGRSLSKADFNVLMQTIAIAAWQGGDTRVASEAGFEAAIAVARADKAWQSFKSDNGPDVTNLAMNFYLKSSEGHHRGFEFTHKSFGDYLAARAILDIALDLPPVIMRKVDHALADWVEATSTGTLTGEILQFLRDEVRLRIVEHDSTEKTIISAKRAFEKLIDTTLAEGMPVQGGGHTWRVAELRQANAESMAWAVVNAFSLALAARGSEHCAVTIDWPNPKESFQALIKRLTHGGTRDSPVLKCFSYIVAPESFLFGMAISWIDLRGAKMPDSNFNGCHLLSANLEGGDFSESRFERAMLDNANMKRGNFTRCNFADARLSHPIVDGAVFDGSRVSNVTLIHSSPQILLDAINTFRLVRNSAGDPDSAFWKRISEVRKVSKEMHSDPRRLD